MYFLQCPCKALEVHPSSPVSPFAAKSLQSCPTLCDPIDGSPPGFPVPGILQARTPEWVAISSSNAWKWKGKVKSLSRVRLFATPWTAASQAPLSVGFSRQVYWSGVPLPSPSPFNSPNTINISALRRVLRALTWEHVPLPPPLCRVKEWEERALLRLNSLNWLPCQLMEGPGLFIVIVYTECGDISELLLRPWMLNRIFPVLVLPSMQSLVPLCLLGIPKMSGRWKFLLCFLCCCCFSCFFNGERDKTCLPFFH